MNNLITAVNKDMPLPPNGSTNLAGTKSILWEKVAGRIGVTGRIGVRGRIGRIGVKGGLVSGIYY